MKEKQPKEQTRKASSCVLERERRITIQPEKGREDPQISTNVMKLKKKKKLAVNILFVVLDWMERKYKEEETGVKGSPGGAAV